MNAIQLLHRNNCEGEMRSKIIFRLDAKNHSRALLKCAAKHDFQTHFLPYRLSIRDDSFTELKLAILFF
jgi:hypothetical protein